MYSHDKVGLITQSGQIVLVFTLHSRNEGGWIGLSFSVTKKSNEPEGQLSSYGRL